MPPGPRTRRTAQWAVDALRGLGFLRVVVVACFAVFAAGALWRTGGTGQVLWLDAGVYGAVYVCGALVLLLQRAPSRAARWAWRLLGAGLLANQLGDQYYSSVLARMPEPPAPSWADACYLAWYPLAYAGAVLLLGARERRRTSGTVLDGVVAGLGAAALAAAFVVDDVVQASGASALEVAVSVAYPVGSLLLVLVVVGGCAVLDLRMSVATALVLASFATSFVTDALYTVLDSRDAYSEGGVVDVMYLATVVLMVAAQHRSTRARTPDGERSGTAPALGRVAWRALVLPAAATATSLALIALDQLFRLPALAGPLADACLVAAFARVALTFREVRLDERDAFERLHAQSRTDELTRLLNRRALYEVVEDLLLRASRAEPLSVLILDLDGFKTVNDAYGHATGDALLREVAVRLQATVPPTGSVARLGGDEFAVALPATTTAQARGVAAHVEAAMHPTFVTDGLQLRVGASIGVATATGGTSLSELLHTADSAMYDTKAARVSWSAPAGRTPVVGTAGHR